MAARCSHPREGPCTSKMVTCGEVGAIAGMDSEFGSIPEKGRQRVQFFLLGFFLFKSNFRITTLLQLRVHSFHIHFL